ncbi:hypothetical protein E5D57_002910 [Metarhizium anisopliae]|nr:hypothetical protein E5D57_002910 [Metarhizium anisopliae]
MLLEEDRRKDQKSTLPEYLYSCHFHIYLKLRLPPPGHGLPVPTTPVDGKFYPKRLLPWRTFAHQRELRFNDLRAACAQERRFLSELDTKVIGRLFEENIAEYISDLWNFERFAIEQPVGNILTPIWDDKELRGRYLFADIRVKSVGEMPGFGEHIIARDTRPYGFGVQTSLDGSEHYAFVFDYQHDYVWSVEHLQEALQMETLFEDVNTRVMSKSDTRQGNAQEAWQEYIARILIRVFNFMIIYGVSYGYVAAGKFYVFLYYNPTEPQTLYHHLCVPENVVRDAANEDGWSTYMSNTAVAQLASFCLQSLQSEAAEGPDLEASTQAAKESLAIWSRQGYASEDSETNTCVHCAYNKPAKQYCTQACLLGLKTGRHLANNCPNVQFHRAVGGNEQHAIDRAEFTRLVDEQLRRDPYDYCELLSPWGMYGSTGVLFKLELAPYGYTFVAKGTTATLLCSLEHETNVYDKLHRLQGNAVPVHLGLVELPGGYILPGGLRAVHMMLMSWGGQTVKEEKIARFRSSEAVRNEGIYHDDVCDANLLWNEELGRVMVIDFDYAKILEPPKHKTVVDLSKKERKRGQKRVVANCPGKAKVQDSHPEAV